MIPWEKAFYVDKLIGHLKQEKEKFDKQKKEAEGRTSL